MPGSAVGEIGIVLYPGVQAASVHGLTDLLGIAARLAIHQQEAALSPLRVTHWQSASRDDANPLCVYDSNPDGQAQPSFLIIPPTMVDLPDPNIPGGVVSWVRERHAAGATIVSICSGAFILGETGLVTGRTVSTHPICAQALAERFPEMMVTTSQRVIDYGDVITAGGFLAWVDVGLHLVEKILGASIRAQTAHFILGEQAGSKARYFPGFAPKQDHGDIAVLKAQEWVHMRDGRDASLASMAAAAGLERRTFLRRFASATGTTPIEYCRAVRIARARELLECGNTPQKDIAQSLCYRDVASFARAFRKVTGWAPGSYRKKFGAYVVASDQSAHDASRRKLHKREGAVQPQL